MERRIRIRMCIKTIPTHNSDNNSGSLLNGCVSTLKYIGFKLNVKRGWGERVLWRYYLLDYEKRRLFARCFCLLTSAVQSHPSTGGWTAKAQVRYLRWLQLMDRSVTLSAIISVTGTLVCVLSETPIWFGITVINFEKVALIVVSCQRQLVGLHFKVWVSQATSITIAWGLIERLGSSFQSCGPMTSWYGSGSACLWLIDTDPDPAIFVICLQDANKKIIFVKVFLLISFFEGTFTSFFKDKKSRFVLLFLLDDRRIRIRISD